MGLNFATPNHQELQFFASVVELIRKSQKILSKKFVDAHDP
jgi:hypothetical protein